MSQARRRCGNKTSRDWLGRGEYEVAEQATTGTVPAEVRLPEAALRRLPCLRYGR